MKCYENHQNCYFLIYEDKPEAFQAMLLHKEGCTLKIRNIDFYIQGNSTHMSNFESQYLTSIFIENENFFYLLSFWDLKLVIISFSLVVACLFTNFDLHITEFTIVSNLRIINTFWKIFNNSCPQWFMNNNSKNPEIFKISKRKTASRTDCTRLHSDFQKSCRVLNMLEMSFSLSCNKTKCS